MTRLIRNDDMIGETGVYLNEASNRLNDVKNSFMNHVNNFKINYEGVDGTAIYNVLVNAINRVDELVNTFNYYSEYMIKIAKYDSENIENAIKKIKSRFVTEPIVPQNEISLSSIEGVVKDESEQIKY